MKVFKSVLNTQHTRVLKYLRLGFSLNQSYLIENYYIENIYNYKQLEKSYCNNPEKLPIEFKVFKFSFETLQENKIFKELAHKITWGVGPIANRTALLRSKGI